MATAQQVLERFSVEYRPQTTIGERSTFICFDERAALLRGLQRSATIGRHGGSYVTFNRTVVSRPSDLRYLRTAGGAVGIGEDVHATMRMLRRQDIATPLTPGAAEAYRRYLDRTGNISGIAPAHVLGSLVAQAAFSRNVDICTHVGCLAEGNAVTIGRGIAENQGKNGQDIRGAVTPHWMGRGEIRELQRRVEEAYSDGLENGMFPPDEDTAELLDYGDMSRDGLLRAVPRVPLTAMEHVSDTLILDWRSGVTLDATAATQETLDTGEVWSHYYASMGSMEQLAKIVTDRVVQVDPEAFSEAFVAASFVRNAATSLWLPEQNGQHPGLYSLS